MWCLYRDLKRKKPLCVLECGPGVSTYIISYALYENYKENNVESELISLEENELFFKGLDKCVFSKFKDKTKLILTKKIDKVYSFWIGQGYENIPKKNYDYIFIDGTNTQSHKFKNKTFNFDLIEIINISSKNINGLIDERLSTSYIYREIFGKKINYNFLTNITSINNVNKSDLSKEKLKFTKIDGKIIDAPINPIRYNLLRRRLEIFKDFKKDKKVKDIKF